MPTWALKRNCWSPGSSTYTHAAPRKDKQTIDLRDSTCYLLQANRPRAPRRFRHAASPPAGALQNLEHRAHRLAQKTRPQIRVAQTTAPTSCGSLAQIYPGTSLSTLIEHMQRTSCKTVLCSCHYATLTRSTQQGCATATAQRRKHS